MKYYFTIIAILVCISINSIQASSQTNWDSFVHPPLKSFNMMMDAVFDNDYKKVESLLKSGINPNIETCSKLTPISLAILLNLDSIANLLIQYKETTYSNSLYKTLYYKAINNQNISLIKKYHKSEKAPLLFPKPSYFHSSFSNDLIEYLIPFFQEDLYSNSDFFSKIPFPQTKKEAKRLLHLTHLMGLNGFFPKTKNDSIWLKAITQRSMDSASLPLFKNNVTLNTRIAGIGKTHTGTIDLLLFLGADPLGPTNFDNENALDHRRKASQPFDWKVISLFQKRDPIRINYLLNDDDFFFIALINGNLKEVKERLKKIDLIKKGPTFYNKVLSTAVYSGNVELVNFLKNFSTPFYALKWHYLFQIAIQSHNKNLIQTIISMHPNKKEAYSAYFRKTTGHITNFYKQLAELNQLLPLVKPEIKNKIYSFTDTSNTFLGEILIKYNPETNTFKPYWDFASLYSSLEKCDLCKDYEYFHYPNEPFFLR